MSRRYSLPDLHTGKDREILAAVEDEKPFLCICGGYQMMGQYYKTHTGEQCDYIGALDLYTVGSDTRMIGNYMYEFAPESGGGTVVGFENHSGKTWLGAGCACSARCSRGFGNNGEDKTEGARYKNVFGTYCHGPILPKNPQRLRTCCCRPRSRASTRTRRPAPVRYPRARGAHDYMEKRLRAQA